jgi:trimeric autotransporter adhesin
MKSSTGDSLHFFASIALMMILAAVTVCAQTQRPTTKPQNPSPSAQASDRSAAPNTLLLPILGKGTTNFIPLWTGNYTIGNSLLSQTGNGLNVAGAVTAVSFVGNGATLTNVNAATLGGQSSSNFAQIGANNNFTADQTITGNLNLTGYVNSTLNLQGNLTDSNGQEGANVLGGFAGNAAFPGNNIAPGVIGATIGGGGGVYDPSLLPAVQPPARKRSLQPNQARARQALRNPFAQLSLRVEGSDRAEQSEAEPSPAPMNTGLVSGANGVTNNPITPCCPDWATIAGGLNNTASGFAATVGGGYSNTASGNYSTVAGGDGNNATASQTTVAGGSLNTASDVNSTVGGGFGNTASGSGDGIGSATVAGGSGNTASADWSTVAGGRQNIASGQHATAGGGDSNIASGAQATVPGGLLNQALGIDSFAAGCVATANNNFSFVWSDNCINGVSDTSASQFVAEASGGFYFYTSLSGASGSGATLASGSGSRSSLSDRSAKANFSSVDPSSLLEKLAAMPVSTWNYKTQADSIRHLGPTAQDFREAFGLGEDDKHISTVDAEGVALAGVQALYKLSQQRIAELNQALSEKTRQLEDLERRLSRLEQLTDATHSVAVVWPSKEPK